MITTSQSLAPHRVAAVQMVSTASVETNLAAAKRLVAMAADQGAALIALPEYFCLMGHADTDKVAAREREGAGPIQDFLAECAARHRVWLVGGTVPIEVDDPAISQTKVRNTTFVFDPDGKVAARYDKIHLFGFQKGDEQYDESRTIAPGNAPVSFIADFASQSASPHTSQPLRIGLTICYDLRFPELYRSLAKADETGINTALIIVPSAFTYTTGRVHWEILLRARAIENQCYILAPAQGGRHENGRRTWGHSMLIDPWGEIIALLPEGEGVVIGELDPTRIAEVRENLPALKHRVMS